MASLHTFDITLTYDLKMATITHFYLDRDFKFERVSDNGEITPLDSESSVSGNAVPKYMPWSPFVHI